MKTNHIFLKMFLNKLVWSTRTSWKIPILPYAQAGTDPFAPYGSFITVAMIWRAPQREDTQKKVF